MTPSGSAVAGMRVAAEAATTRSEAQVARTRSEATPATTGSVAEAAMTGSVAAPAGTPARVARARTTSGAARTDLYVTKDVLFDEDLRRPMRHDCAAMITVRPGRHLFVHHEAIVPRNVVEGRRPGYGGDMASKTKESKKGTVVTALGESALTGLPGKVGGAVAKPVSQRTRWSEQQIRTAIRLALFAWALYRVLRLAVRAIRNR